MNKKLMALAVAGAFAAPAAMAQTNVTLYGTAAMSVDMVDGGSGGTPTASADNSERRMRVSSNTSLFGLRIKEDLGNGLDVHAQLETAINIDTGGGIGWGSSTGNRNNFVGFGSKSWGAIDFGLIDTPLKTSTGKVDLFGGGNTIADYRALFTTRDTSVRAENSIMYSSPTFSGFSFKAQYGTYQESGSTKNPGIWSLGGTYDQGPIFATLAYEEFKKAAAGSSTAATSILDEGGGVTGIGGHRLTYSGTAGEVEAKIKTWRAGFGYNFGVARIGIAYEGMKTKATATGGVTFATGGTTTAASTNLLADSTTSTEYKRHAWHVSGGWNFSKASMIAVQYTDAGKVNDIANSGASQWTVGVRHDMSKRTNVYALYTRVNNDSAARYLLGGGATGTSGVVPVQFGEDPSAFSVGVVHRF